jgi:hypothetical protein
VDMQEKDKNNEAVAKTQQPCFTSYRFLLSV